MPSSKYPMSPSMRAPNSPKQQARQTSIVEMLSTPPPLDTEYISNLDITIPRSPASSISSVLLSSSANNNNNNNNNNISSSTASSSNTRNSSVFNDNNTFPNNSENVENSVVDNLILNNDSLTNLSLNTSTTDFLAENSNTTQISRNPSMSSNFSQCLNGASLEWQDIKLGELVEKNKLIVIDSTISVERAFDTLVKNGLTSVPVEEYENDLNCLTFDYTDLNAYLLLVLNKIRPETLKNMDYTPKDDIPKMIKKAQVGQQVPVSFVIRLTNKNPFIKLTEYDTLSTVVEILGTGVHRIAITNDNKLTGILSQRRLVKYLWDNARRFPSMEPLLSSSISSLHIGSTNPISIFGDQPLIEALMTMHDLKMSSLAVVDRNYHLLGNISVTDVRLVSTTSKSDLLYKTCLHFISVILNSRGLENGKDSFPIFHVTSHTSLGRAIAKMVATKSHRLWIVKPEASSSNSSTPSTPDSPHSTHLHSSHSHSGHLHSHHPHHSTPLEDDTHATGKIVGVLSLTDILSLFAKTLGKAHVEPNMARKQRRRSSSGVASVSTSGSLEMFRRSISEQTSSEKLPPPGRKQTTD
ncbi:cell separation during budding [Pichia californica]|nr:cell separation during budding [[Candida] californica]